MRRWRRALLAVVGLALVAAGALFLVRPWVQEGLRGRLQSTLAESIGLPVLLDGLEIELFPPRVRLARFVAGEVDAPVASLDGLDATFDPFLWSLSGRVAMLRADLSRLPSSPPAEPGSAKSDLEIALPAWLPTLALDLASADVNAPGFHAVAGASKLRLEHLLGPFILALESPGLSLEHAGDTLVFPELAAEVELRRGGAVPRAAKLSSEAGHFTAEASGANGAKAEATLDLPRLSRFLALEDHVEGTVAWKGELSFADSGVTSLDDVGLAGDLTLESPAWNEYRARSLVSSIALADGRVSVANLKLVLEQGEVAGSAQVELAQPHALRGDLTIDAPDLTAIDAELGKQLASGPLAAQVKLEGNLTPPSLEGSLRASVVRLQRRMEGAPPRPAATQPGTLDAEMVADFRRVDQGTAASGTLALKPSGSVTTPEQVKFNVAVTGAGDLSGTVKVAVDDARQLRPLAPAMTGGKITADVVLAGSLEAPRLQGSALADKLDIAGIRFDRIGGGFEADTASVLAKAIELRAVGGVASLDGRVALVASGRNDWRAKLDHVDLAAVWVALDTVGVSLPYLTGILNGEATAMGPWEAIDLKGQLAVAPLSIGPERLASVSLRVDSRAQKWTVDGEIVRRQEEVAKIAGSGTGLGSMWLSGWSTPWRIAGFRSLDDLPPARGEAVLSIDLYGRLDAPLGRAQLTLQDLGLGERELGTFSARVDALADKVFQLSLVDAEERLSLEGSIRSDRGQPFKARAEMRDFDLAHLLAPAQAVKLASHGSAQFEGRLGDLARSLTGELRLTQFTLGRDALQMSAPRPIVVRVRDGRVDVVSFDLEGGFGKVAISGNVGLVGTIALDVHVDADARVIEAIPKSPVKWATGRALLDARIRRPAGGELDLEGNGSVEKLSVDLGLPFLITDTTGGFVLHGTRVTLEALKGRAGGGVFALSGYVDVDEGLQLSYEATSVNSNFLDWLEDEVSGSGEIRGPFEAIEITGDIHVNNALYDRDVELSDLLPVFRRELGPTPPKPGEKPIYLDLKIRAPDSIYIDNNIARAEFAADLRITGTDLQPRLSGEIELLDGEATIFDRRFEITLGRIDFGGTPKINPKLEFNANADVSTPEGEYNIIAEVSGTLDDPRVRLSADDSSLTTNDVVTLLTVGKTMAQLQSEGGGVSAGDLTKLAPMLYGSQVQRGVQRFLPIDRFSLEPGFSRTTGDFEPKVTVGTEIARGLRGTLSTTLAAQTQNTVQLEYQLTPSMLVVGSWESRTDTSEGGFGGALKFRYRYRYLPRFSLLPPEWWK